ncbi:MAG: TMEM43 family protein, partial [Desulfovibrionaceae bacterium]|nr:TMEM43 family protein [Desulfovibrionaceae bacterium]
TLNDPVFGVSINAIRLERTVEFYQWMEQSKSEKKKKLGGGEETVTTYTYAPKWTSRPVDSSEFTDPQARTANKNIVLAGLENFKTQATNVTFGAYRLPEFMINSLSGAISLNVSLSETTIAKLNKDLALAAQEPRGEAQVPQDDNMLTQQTSAQMVHVSGDTVLLGASPSTPRIGDVRVTFKETRPDTVSIIAKLNGDTFETYRASNGKTVSQLSMGTRSLENIYGAAHSSNATMTWILRVVGALLIIAGLKLIVAPLAVIADVIPLLGSIVGAGAGLVCTLLGLAWSLVIIAIAWLRFRPLIGGCILALAAVLIALLFIKGRSRKAA